MQEMILVQPEARTDTIEQATVESLRTDERILSIVVISTRNTDREMPNERQPTVSEIDGQEKFQVSDLLSRVEYIVTDWKGLGQLSFMVGRHQIRATLQPDADIVEVASAIGAALKLS
jgi:hypothetical protein